MTDPAHTPTPWAVSKRHPRRITASGKLICTAVLRNQNKPSPKNNALGKDEAEALANAAHIVKCVNENEALHKRIAELEAASQWRPIDSAPKDGTWIIAIRPECPVGEWDRVVIVIWSDDFNKWIWPDDRFDVYKDDINETDDDGRYKYDPFQSLDFTHWMPLPAAPVGEA